MTGSIPYIRDFDFTYGKAVSISTNVRRLVAQNPGPFTGWGSNVYLIGQSDIAIIDPGPDIDEHFEMLCKAIGTCSVSSIFVTHHHRDHSSMALRLAQHFSCKTVGFGPPLRTSQPGEGFEEADMAGFIPDILAKDRQIFAGNGWQIECLHTPGHTSNHMCYAVLPDNGLICGDHILAWSTSVVIPPDGTMSEYLASLARVKQREFAELWPGHGPQIKEPEPFLTAYLNHRAMRDQQIMEQLKTGAKSIEAMVPIIYAKTNPKLYPAASISMLAHLIRLLELGRVDCDGRPGLQKNWSLVDES